METTDKLQMNRDREWNLWIRRNGFNVHIRCDPRENLRDRPEYFWVLYACIPQSHLIFKKMCDQQFANDFFDNIGNIDYAAIVTPQKRLWLSKELQEELHMESFLKIGIDYAHLWHYESSVIPHSNPEDGVPFTIKKDMELLVKKIEEFKDET